jgi:hypothetical protein
MSHFVRSFPEEPKPASPSNRRSGPPFGSPSRCVLITKITIDRNHTARFIKQLCPKFGLHACVDCNEAGDGGGPVAFLIGMILQPADELHGSLGERLEGLVDMAG